MRRDNDDDDDDDDDQSYLRIPFINVVSITQPS